MLEFPIHNFDFNLEQLDIPQSAFSADDDGAKTPVTILRII